MLLIYLQIYKKNSIFLFKLLNAPWGNSMNLLDANLISVIGILAAIGIRFGEMYPEYYKGNALLNLNLKRVI